MARKLTCFRCKATLRVRDGTRDRWLTCPECLASIPNAAPEPIAERPTEREDDPAPSCRACGEAMRPNWRLCPACGSGQATTQRVVGVDDQVRGDQWGTWIWLTVLVGLVLGGAALFFAVGGPKLVGVSQDGPRILVAFVVLLLAIIVGVGFLLFTLEDPTQRAVAGSVGSLAVGVVITLGLALLVLAAICAGIANFFATCGGAKNPPANQQQAPPTDPPKDVPGG